MKTQTALALTMAVLLTTPQSQAGWNPIRDLENGIKTVRTVVDSSYAKKQAEKAKLAARNQLMAQKHTMITHLDQNITKLVHEYNDLKSKGGDTVQLQLKQAEIDFQKAIKKSVSADFDRKIASI